MSSLLSSIQYRGEAGLNVLVPLLSPYPDRIRFWVKAIPEQCQHLHAISFGKEVLEAYNRSLAKKGREFRPYDYWSKSYWSTRQIDPIVCRSIAFRSIVFAPRISVLASEYEERTHIRANIYIVYSILYEYRISSNWTICIMYVMPSYRFSFTFSYTHDSDGLYCQNFVNLLAKPGVHLDEGLFTEDTGILYWPQRKRRLQK